MNTDIATAQGLKRLAEEKLKRHIVEIIKDFKHDTGVRVSDINIIFTEIHIEEEIEPVDTFVSVQIIANL